MLFGVFYYVKLLCKPITEYIIYYKGGVLDAENRNRSGRIDRSI